MTPDAKIEPLFATPFAIVPLGDTARLNAALTTLFLARALDDYRDLDLPRDPLCFRSREDLFQWPDEPVQELRQRMLAGICHAVMAVNLLTEAEFDSLGLGARARFAIVRPNGCIPASTAPMASWYAIYCVAAPPDSPARVDSGMLRLYSVRHGAMFVDAANCRLRPPFDTSHQLRRPVAGEMAVFPAPILHEIALNRTDANLLLVSARVRFASSSDESMPPW